MAGLPTEALAQVGANRYSSMIEEIKVKKKKMRYESFVADTCEVNKTYLPNTVP
jgi:hypothetical protein